MNFVLGVDEAGRAPLAGPVAVGAVIVPVDYDILTTFPGVNDSKKLTEGKREELFELLMAEEEKGNLRYHVHLSSHEMIDEKGMTRAVKAGIIKGVQKLAKDPSGVQVLLDGALFAPSDYEQETIIKGDEKIPAIMLASIAAKVTRDRLMRRFAKKYPEYGFEKHKGYGTSMHYEALRIHGLCDIHRRTYCKGFVDGV